MRTVLDQVRLDSLGHYARQALRDGVALELGVYQGGSLRVIAQVVHPMLTYGFDTFSGMPGEKRQEQEHVAGDFGDTSIEMVRQHCQGLDNITLIQGVFPDSAQGLALDRITFAHLDADYYQSTLDALQFIWPRMPVGGIIVFDDYLWPPCPGVVKAIADFGIQVTQSALYQAVIVK